jgi:ParB family chromosome partitioning protein
MGEGIMKSPLKNLLNEITKAGPVTAQASPPPPRMMAGSVKSFGEQLQHEVEEVKEIREQIAKGEIIVELDPHDLDVSFASDRIDNDEDEAFQSLVESIRSSGQQIPILVRPAQTNGRFQIAFGHRRVRVARTLGIKVKAVVRRLTDDELIIAQGQENNARKDLTYIEKSLFAWRLSNSGVAREVISIALGVSKTHLSDHLTIIQTVTPEIVLKIGAAPSIGRTRWQALADRLKNSDAIDYAIQITATHEFQAAKDRFAHLVERLAEKKTVAQPTDLKTTAGILLGQFVSRPSGSRLVMRNRRFSAYLEARLPDLIREFEADQNNSPG